MQEETGKKTHNQVHGKLIYIEQAKNKVLIQGNGKGKDALTPSTKQKIINIHVVDIYSRTSQRTFFLMRMNQKEHSELKMFVDRVEFTITLQLSSSLSSSIQPIFLRKSLLLDHKCKVPGKGIFHARHATFSIATETIHNKVITTLITLH